jgi:hypothetical protein
MEYAIVALFFAAVWHFVYQAIVLPGIHVKQRNSLFELRDRLRSYHFERSDRAHEAAFQVAQDGINNAINSVEVLGLDMRIRIQRLRAESPKFRELIEKRNNVLKAANCAEIDAVVKEANAVMRDIFVFNSGGWTIYVIPVFLCMIFYQKIVATARDLFAFDSQGADLLFDHARAVACA